MVLEKQAQVLIRQILAAFVEEHRQLSLLELNLKASVSTTAKHSFSILAERLFVESGLDVFIHDKTGIVPHLKTIRTDVCGRVKESVSLPSFKYCEIVHEEWQHSKLRNYFLNNIFVFIVFQCKRKDAFLNNAVLWQMPQEILESEVKRVWSITKGVLERGEIVKYIDPANRYFTFFPACSESFCIHVRPHAQSKQDTAPLPHRDRLTGLNAYPKHSFWLNNSFVQKIIS